MVPLKLLLFLVAMETINSLESDYMLTCPRPVKHKWRSGRWLRMQEEVLRGVPCGVENKSGSGGWWCGVPGEGYPWPSVRRFITENTGLMRRMYGEVRQLNLLRMEFSDTNTIDDYEEKPRKFSESHLTTDTLTTSPLTTTPMTTTSTTPGTTEPMETTETTVDMVTEIYFGEESEDKMRDDGDVKQPVGVAEERTNVKKRAVNACPVREEVVAPYWANNTRGEILALLNLYPFEQYVHWEKCNHEHEQMYCRQGCRCEQQYRLHRLLAFDPTNECRGIFSDWFRFPSCCICKCYLTEEEISTHLHSNNNILSENNRSPRKWEDDFYDEPDVDGVDNRFFKERVGPR